MNQSLSLTPVLLLTGYLGSGKTTLLNRILTNRRGVRFAVIVNDIGEVNIDASLIQKGGVVGQNGDEDLVALQNGCICCTLRSDLIRQIAELIDSGQFDYLVIEASGICEPEPIARTICTMQQAAKGGPGGRGPRLDCIVTVVDALRMQSDFAGGNALVKGDVGEEDIENLVIQQIEFCNMILLNKISEVGESEAEGIKSVIRAIQPKAEIVECDYCEVDLDRLLYTHLFDYEKTVTSAAWIEGIEREVTEEEEKRAHCHHHNNSEHHDEHHHHDEDECEAGCHHHHHEEGEADEYGISTFVYYRRAPFDFNRFDRFCANWPKGVIRTKGVLYFSHNRDMSILFEQAGVQKKMAEAGLWYATAPEEERKRLMAMDSAFMRDWDEDYGDRMIKLVFIGKDMKRKAIEDALDFCLA